MLRWWCRVGLWVREALFSGWMKVRSLPLGANAVIDRQQSPMPDIPGVTRLWRWALVLCTILVWLSVAGCVVRKSPTGNTPPKVESNVLSRVLLPPRSGQTIMVPRFMADVQKLWSPLDMPIPAPTSAPAPVSVLEGQFPLQWPERHLGGREREAAERYFRRLVGAYRGTTTQALRRASGHMPVLLEGLRRMGLPQELACLPLVESAFENQAVSRAGAAGLWQLMPETARRYGLEVSATRDERFDVARATIAATAYLHFLYGHFGDWPLALAAYNCGEGTMRRALARTESSSLAELLEKNSRLPREDRVLQEETVQYVPKVTAAVAAMTHGRGLGLSVAALLPEGGTPLRNISLPTRTDVKKDFSADKQPMPPLQNTRQAEFPESRNQQKYNPLSISTLPRITRVQ